MCLRACSSDLVNVRQGLANKEVIYHFIRLIHNAFLCSLQGTCARETGTDDDDDEEEEKATHTLRSPIKKKEEEEEEEEKNNKKKIKGKKEKEREKKGKTNTQKKERRENGALSSAMGRSRQDVIHHGGLAVPAARAARCRLTVARENGGPVACPVLVHATLA
ncbi:hypothetical protein C0Q70_11115 [Pomacea canaliculata]|uniref:Uncharacterized protein n=1 Tax=Pomacea canaliculata TaxID=400727 RepID=A0A2T7P534_POMCA|nr:hypothetical protein C0Q70_11115 [Pomacea canaliculata]